VRFDAHPNPDQLHAVLTITGEAKTLAQLGFALDPKTEVVLIQAEAHNFRYTRNGTTPTETLGYFVTPHDYVELSREEAQQAKFIHTAGTDTTVQISGFIK
jgi:hypothetical protein